MKHIKFANLLLKINIKLFHDLFINKCKEKKLNQA